MYQIEYLDNFNIFFKHFSNISLFLIWHVFCVQGFKVLYLKIDIFQVYQIEYLNNFNTFFKHLIFLIWVVLNVLGFRCFKSKVSISRCIFVISLVSRWIIIKSILSWSIQLIDYSFITFHTWSFHIVNYQRQNWNDKNCHLNTEYQLWIVCGKHYPISLILDWKSCMPINYQ